MPSTRPEREIGDLKARPKRVEAVEAAGMEWRAVSGFPKYEVSTHGVVRNARTKEALKPSADEGKRCRVLLYEDSEGGRSESKRSKRTLAVRRIVAEAFLPDWDPAMKVKHLDGDASNNAVDNLVVTTNGEMNAGRTFENGHPRRRVKIECYEDGVYRETFDGIDAAARATGARQQNISKVLAGQRETSGGYGWRYAASAVIPGEEWRPFRGDVKVSTDVEVSTEGRVRRASFAGGYARSSTELATDNDGYPIFGIGARNFKLHLAVAKTFVPNPEDKPQVNHKDGDKTNARADNLEWVTSSENSRHAHDTGLFKTKRGVERIDASGRVIGRYASIAEASRATGQHESRIRDHANGNRAVPEWRRTM